MEDRRCKLGLSGRLELVRRIEEGSTLRAAAAALSVAPATAHRWWQRWRKASDAERRSLACLATRSSRPHSCPWSLPPATEEAILEARRRTNYGPMRLAGLVGRPRSTVWKVLRRNGASRRARPERRQSRRYEWSEPGALLHIDAFRAPKFDRPGHWATGERSVAPRSRGAGTTYVIGVVDDHTRLAYCELHSGETAAAVATTIRRAAAWFCEQGCGSVEAVMSDNARSYTGQVFGTALSELGARHILTPPYTPRWNGKVERFFGTLDREWAHGRVWSSSRERDRALSSFLRFYNRRRGHSAAGGRPPLSRVHEVRGRDN